MLMEENNMGFGGKNEDTRFFHSSATIENFKMRFH